MIDLHYIIKEEGKRSHLLREAIKTGKHYFLKDDCCIKGKSM